VQSGRLVAVGEQEYDDAGGVSSTDQGTAHVDLIFTLIMRDGKTLKMNQLSVRFEHLSLF